MAKVIISVGAGDDLEGIFNYIVHNTSESRDAKFLKQIEGTMQKLANSTGMGTRRDHSEPDLLGFPEGNYIIYYQKMEGGIRVIRVIHGSRDIEKQFNN